jgi:Na+/H+-dicarboxylate symporter
MWRFQGLIVRESVFFPIFGNLNKPAENMKGKRLTVYILIAMALGILVGYFVNRSSSPESIQKFASNIKLLTTIFLRLVQMIIAPLVFTTLLLALQNLAI